MVDESILSFLPKKLLSKLLPFQKEGIVFGINRNGRCLIADEMGLGKTLQALSLAYFYQIEWPLLIIVPPSIKFQWIDEIEKWFPHIQPNEINCIEHGADISEIDKCNITVVTYGLLRNRSCNMVQQAIQNKKYKVIILDESHYIKNRTAFTTKFIVPILKNSLHVILLTGTPALNSPQELYPQLEAISPNLFGSWLQFAKTYCDPKFKYFGRHKSWDTSGASNVDELECLLKKNVMIRRLKNQVLTQLPPKQRQKILFKLPDSTIKKELEKEMEKLRIYMEKNKLTLNDLNNNNGDLSKQKKIDPTDHVTFRQLFSNVVKLTYQAKIESIKEHLKMLCEDKSLKMLIFAHHVEVVKAIQEFLIELKIDLIKIDGSVPMSERPILVKRFQEQESTRIALLSIRAAGVGLTLTAASLVVFVELDWTPSMLKQCEDRAHRMGQKSCVIIQYLVARNTMDEWMWTKLNTKTNVLSSTLDGFNSHFEAKRGSKDTEERLAKIISEEHDIQEETKLDVIVAMNCSGQKTLKQFYTPSSKFNKSTESSHLSQRSLINDVTDISSPSLNNNNDTIVLSDDEIDCTIDDNISSNIDFNGKTSSSILNFDSSIYNTCNDPKQCQISYIDHDTGDLNDFVIDKTNLLNNKRCVDSSDLPSSKKSKLNNNKSRSIKKKRKSIINEKHNSSLNNKSIIPNKEEKMHPLALNSNNFSDEYLQTNKFLLIKVQRLIQNSPHSKILDCKNCDKSVFPKDEKLLNTLNINELTDPQSKNADDSVRKSKQSDFFSQNSSLSDTSVTNVNFPDDLKIIKLIENVMDSRPSLQEQQSSTNDFALENFDLFANDFFNDCNDDEDNFKQSKEYPSLKFLCSKITGRFYIYDQDGVALNEIFLPTEIECGDFSSLSPPFANNHVHVNLIKKFVQEWNQLSGTKQKILLNQREPFSSPLMMYDACKSRNNSKQRFTTSKDSRISIAKKVLKSGGKIKGKLKNIDNKKEKSTDCDSALIPLLCVHG